MKDVSPVFIVVVLLLLIAVSPGFVLPLQNKRSEASELFALARVYTMQQQQSATANSETQNAFPVITPQAESTSFINLFDGDSTDANLKFERIRPGATEAPADSIMPSSDIAVDSTAKDSTNDSSKTSPVQLTKDTSKSVLKPKLTKKDSLRILDSLQLDSMKYDSTARLTHMKYRRKDSPTLSFFTPKQSRLFAEPSGRVRTYKIDSTGKYVTIEEKVGERGVKFPLKVPIDEFLALKIRSKEQESWDELGYKYELKSGKKDLSNLLKDITNFEIPLPSVGVLSIFGAPKISLRINGAVDIHGAWRNETTEGVTASRLGNTRNEPDFRQQVQVNVSGTIGDKLQIDADWNTERTFEYENQLKIKYTGYEDEIVQSVEAGNVSLQTAPLVGGSEALFGIKAALKLGPLSLTAIASQKKGEVKEKTLSGGSSSAPFTKRVYEYSKNHYFLDEVYADTSADLNIFYNYFGNPNRSENAQYKVKDIEVWKSTYSSQIEANSKQIVAHVKLPPRGISNQYSENLRNTGLAEEGKIYVGRFVRLVENQDYTLHPETGFISLKSLDEQQDVIAVAYRIQNTESGPEDDIIYGEFSKDRTDSATALIMKLIKPKNLQPSFTDAWKLQLRNIYPLGISGVKVEGFELDIKYHEPAGEPVSVLGDVRLITAFGLDITNASKSGGPDGQFDFLPGNNIFPETGEIIFPKLQPFGMQLPASLPNADSLRYKKVYENTSVLAQRDESKDKFIITGKSSGASSADYQLGFNIVENSVKVILNGRELTSGTDYVVDYTMGSLRIRNEAALVPGANLRISYEENDLFQLASKTLFGVRGMFDFSKNTKLGFSLLTLSQQTLSDKVRLGEEPLSNTIYGLDFSTQHDLPFITRFMDKLYSTREMSSITFRGEAAMMNPDPNTKKSTVSSDDGESIAYIDDFEGSKRTIPIGISYTQWRESSPPVDNNRNNVIDSIRSRMDYKGKAWWYNVLPSRTSVKEIWPKKLVAQGEETVTILDFKYSPYKSGAYNYTPKTDLDRKRNWGGMTKSFGSTAIDLKPDNLEYIEFWARIDYAPPGSKIFIDLGKISEDIIPNNQIDTEDKNANGLIDEGEDLGLDKSDDATEAANIPGKTGPDPAGDNFSFSNAGDDHPEKYESITGTEGNAALTDVGRFPDTEDLNRNYTLDISNAFSRYCIPLSTDETVNPYLAGGSSSGWYLYRIPLKDTFSVVGNSADVSVEAFRFLITGVDDSVHIKFAEINLVGNQWERNVVDKDTSLKISVVNIEDNPDYISPGGVERERDRSRPDQQILKNEQSLRLEISNLQHMKSVEAKKPLTRPLDLFNYRQMKIFVHTSSANGPSSISYYVDANNYNGEVYFRFGSDSSHYYEYRQPIRENPADNNWTEMKIVFSELTALKQARDSANQSYRIKVPGTEDHYYIVKGSPTLTSVKFLSVGISHRQNEDPLLQQPISGEIWVNELRVIGADDTKGWAYTGSVSLKLADLISLNYNYSRTDPYFHRLSERFGSRNESINWGFSADMDFVKFLPVDRQESQLKLSYSHTEAVGKPVYLPGTDVKVDEAATLQKQKLIAAGYSEQTAATIAEKTVTDVQTINTSDSWALPSIKLKIPTNNWLVRDTWNSLSFGFNYNQTNSRNPSVSKMKNWQWNANMAYNLTISSDYYIDISALPFFNIIFSFIPDYKGYKIFYTPQSISYNISARRQRQEMQYRPTGTSTPKPDTTRDFSATRGATMSWRLTENGLMNLSVNYSFDYTSTLAYLEVDSRNEQRRSSAIFYDIFTGVFFGKDQNFNQRFDLRTAPKLPSFWDLNKNITLSTGYNATYRWSDNPLQPELGRSVGVANNINVSLTVRWKSIFEKLLLEQKSEQPQGVRGGYTPPVAQQAAADTARATADTAKGLRRFLTLDNGWKLIKSLTHTAFVDYDNIRLNYSHDNTISSSGIRGTGSGFKNFWGLIYNSNEGPSRAYMLGISTSPGLRARNGALSDNSSKRNNLDFSTSKPLWEGARVDVSWKVNWSVNAATSFATDAFGTAKITNVNKTGTLARSFISIPPWSVFKVFKSGLDRVDELHKGSNKNINDAFVEGFESINWFSRVPMLNEIVKYIPRPNWRISWDGLEKFFPFKNYAKRVSFDHSYSSDYNEGYKFDQNDTKEVTSQRITYGFQPLIGLNITFNDLWSGNFGGNVKYSTRSSYDLSPTTKNITEDFSKDIGVTLSYNKSGFEIPLFGLSLKNDFEFSFSYTNTKNSSILYNMNDYNGTGVPQNGTVRTSLEPRVKYVMSSRVTLSIFYKRSTTKPEGASRIPETTTNEAGLDVRISIQ